MYCMCTVCTVCTVCTTCGLCVLYEHTGSYPSPSNLICVSLQTGRTRPTLTLQQGGERSVVMHVREFPEPQVGDAAGKHITHIRSLSGLNGVMYTKPIT